MGNEKKEQNLQLPNEETKEDIQLRNEENEQNVELQEDLSEEENKQFTCDECGKSYSRKRRLTQHMLKHVESNQKVFICEPCGKTFPLECYFNKHNKRKHAGFKEFHCGFCGSSFRTREQLEEHELIHGFEKAVQIKGASEIPEHTQVQNFGILNEDKSSNPTQKFDDQGSWQTKIKSAEYPCDSDQWDRSFQQILYPETLKKHLPHKGELSKSKVSFRKTEEMPEAEITHAAECEELRIDEDSDLLTLADNASDFSCGPCGKSFPFKACIIRHNKNVHGLRWDGKDGYYMPKPEERTKREIERQGHKTYLENYVSTSVNKFICEQCKKSFSDNSTLTQHMSTHKLLKCTLCEVRGVKAKFATVDALEVHKLSHPNSIGHAIEIQNNGEATVKNPINSQEWNTRFQINKQTDECLFYCKACDLPFQNSSSLKKHKETHRMFECKVCSYRHLTARFTSIAELKKHKLKHNRRRGKMTEWNPRSNIQGFRADKADWRVQKPAEYQFDSNQYKQSFPSSSKMGKMKAEVQEFQLEDHQFGKAEPSKLSFDEQDKLPDTNSKYFHCDQCKARFSRRFLLEEHKLSHTHRNFLLQKNDERYKFQIPNEELQNKEKVQNFRLQTEDLRHTFQLPNKELQCRNTDASKLGFKGHKLSDTSSHFFHCDQCKAWFSRRYLLEEHKLSHIHRSLQFQKRNQRPKFLLPNEKLQSEEQVPNLKEKAVENVELKEEKEILKFQLQNEDKEHSSRIRTKERNWNLCLKSKNESGNFSSKGE